MMPVVWMAGAALAAAGPCDDALTQLRGFTWRSPASTAARATVDEALQTQVADLNARLTTAQDACHASLQADQDLSALAHLGAAYERAAALLHRAPIPGYLTDAQRAVYVEGVREEALMHEARALEAWTTVQKQEGARDRIALLRGLDRARYLLRRGTPNQKNAEKLAVLAAEWTGLATACGAAEALPPLDRWPQIGFHPSSLNRDIAPFLLDCPPAAAGGPSAGSQTDKPAHTCTERGAEAWLQALACPDGSRLVWDRHPPLEQAASDGHPVHPYAIRCGRTVYGAYFDTDHCIDRHPIRDIGPLKHNPPR